MKAGDRVRLRDGRSGEVAEFRYPVTAWMDGGELRMKRQSMMPIVVIKCDGDDEATEFEWKELVVPQRVRWLVAIFVAAVLLGLAAAAVYFLVPR